MGRKIVWICALVSALSADDNAWKTHSEFSYINTSGNTDTSSLAFEGLAKKSWDQHGLRIHLDAYQSSDSGKTSKQNWSTEVNYDYQYSDTIGLNYVVGYKDDRFSGFEYQFYTGPGLSVKVIAQNDQKLTLQGNILYAQDKPDGDSAESYVGVKAGLEYERQIAENLKFLQEAVYRTNLENGEEFFLYSKTALQAKINSMFSMGVSYKIDYANTPPDGYKKTDKTFLASLIIDY